MNQAFWLARQSLFLDRRLLGFDAWPMSSRLGFIVKKYQVLLSHLFQPFDFGRSNTTWNGETIYYDSRFGLSGYQSMLTRPVNLFKTARVGSFRTVIDCGANVGFFTKMIMQVAPDARVYAIEPVPAIFECLKRNTEMYPQVNAFQTAISDSSGRVRMSFNGADSAVSHVSDQGEVEVPAMTLDDFAARNSIDGVDLLKIDTESFEAHALRGAKALLSSTKYLLIEITIEGNQNYTISSLMSLLVGPGYDFQLAAFRNYADSGEGRMPIMDCLMVNQALQAHPGPAGKRSVASVSAER